MQVGILELDLIIGDSNSLKDKRMVLRSLKDRLRKAFNVSVAKISGQEKWQRATIVIASVGADKKYINSTLSRTVDVITDFRKVELIAQRMEVL